MYMKEIIQNIVQETIHKIIISDPKQKNTEYYKIIIRPVLIKGKQYYQVESFTKTQAFHLNVSEEDIESAILERVEFYKQIEAETSKHKYQVRVSKKGKLFVSKKEIESSINIEQHNRQKNYLLEGIQIPILQDLGIISSEGKVIQKKYDKYKQINRFIEMVEDTLKEKDYQEMTIIDFGCGKSYLTFVLYHYLHEMKQINAKIIGLDLKEKVIEECNQLAEKYHYDQLSFLAMDIKDYQATDKIDMVITLHACDTATDYALYHAIQWNTDIILSVPCCQHEVNQQINPNTFTIITEYGLIQERMSALLTDALRANLLGLMDYQVQVLEFIDSQHSPKNILLRAVKKERRDKERLKKQVEDSLHEFQIEPTLYQLLKEKI